LTRLHALVARAPALTALAACALGDALCALLRIILLTTPAPIFGLLRGLARRPHRPGPSD